MAMLYYAADNSHSSQTDIGFANTWYVLAFNSRQARDRYVDNAEPNSRAARAISRKEIGQYVTREPKPFTGQRYALTIAYKEFDGCVGEIDVAHPDDPNFLAAL